MRSLRFLSVTFSDKLVTREELVLQQQYAPVIRTPGTGYQTFSSNRSTIPVIFVGVTFKAAASLPSSGGATVTDEKQSF